MMELYPTVFNEHAAKYKGRESVMSQQIPPLSCAWNDALHLSPIHPQVIRDTWEQLGFRHPDVPTSPMDVFQIPMQLLNAERTATFRANGRLPASDFVLFNSKTYKELTSVPPQQIDDWHDQKKNGVPLFWYSSIMHIVTLDELDISKLKLITTI